MKMEPILRLEEIKKAYGDRKILKSLSFSIHPGEIVGL
ncbi:MAG: phosphonate ABC transporter ATP-binding protein, partial [Chlamydiae bacterium]|nr:phosphonate ABC transporter ATP-binding protein [Chlamydiota bacterium]